METILAVGALTLFGALETVTSTCYDMLGDPRSQFAAAPVRAAIRGES